MNQRIRELADQCWNNFDLFGVEIKTPDAFAEKFAELIVRECAEVATKNQYQPYTAGHYVLKHFGVKE